MTDNSWFRRWPNHCTACHGSGIAGSYVEMHGFTHGPGETITEPCDAMDADQCHRCAEHEWDDMTQRCKACGWTGAGPDDVGPPPDNGDDFVEPDPEPDYNSFPEPPHYY